MYPVDLNELRIWELSAIELALSKEIKRAPYARRPGLVALLHKLQAAELEKVELAKASVGQ